MNPLHIGMFFVALFCGVSATVAGDETPIDYATTLRQSVTRDFPGTSGTQLGSLPANTPVWIYERSRLWVRVRVANAPEAALAWVSLLDLRFGAAAPPPPRAPASGGGFAAFSRSVSGLLGGFRGHQSNYAAPTATIGIRGLTAGELAQAAPNFQAYAESERFVANPYDAQAYAFAAGLVPQRLPYLVPPAVATPASRPTPFR